MRVLSKAELDNGIILNELVLIMENFGVADGDEDAEEDYIPDTETDSVRGDEPTEEGKDSKKAAKKRTYDIKKIDEKGMKILKKLARFLLR